MIDGEFTGKVALVTGGGSGIGRATAIAFARAGARVAVDDISEEGGAETVNLIAQGGGEAMFVLADVTDEAAVARMVAETVAAFGRIDCAFNNAGISGGARPDEFWDTALFDHTFDINAKGVFLCLKHEIAQMLKQDDRAGKGRGAIVNTSSVAGMVGPGHPSYVGSKHAVTGMTRTVALRYATDGIRVNAVCPGAIRTPMVERVIAASPESARIIEKMHPMKRIGEADEIADAVLFLCSDKARFMTGHPMAIDGGYLAG
jgi:NAD(P)-dependent dehydrogenase (short-subunit alcohol dehydrogenase family)